MKSTGIVRKIDDLGRIVIPKEVRRQLRVREGDAFEIYIEKDMVCFKKYSPAPNYITEVEKLKGYIKDEYSNRNMNNEVKKIEDSFNNIIKILTIIDNADCYNLEE